MRWHFIYPLLALSGCHLLLTGSPIPLWFTEHLDHPVAVEALTDRALLLSDGRGVSLPFIKRVPKDHPVFLLALKHGVEVGQDGEVVGLLRIHRFCGNDPVWWRTSRVNLSDLAGILDPDGIDDAAVHPDEIASLKENQIRGVDRHGMPFFVLNQCAKMRRIYALDASRSKSHEEPR